jgi:hypothetical protein
MWKSRAAVGRGGGVSRHRLGLLDLLWPWGCVQRTYRLWCKCYCTFMAGTSRRQFLPRTQARISLGDLVHAKPQQRSFDAGALALSPARAVLNDRSGETPRVHSPRQPARRGRKGSRVREVSTRCGSRSASNGNTPGFAGTSFSRGLDQSDGACQCRVGAWIVRFPDAVADQRCGAMRDAPRNGKQVFSHGLRLDALRVCDGQA